MDDGTQMMPIKNDLVIFLPSNALPHSRAFARNKYHFNLKMCKKQQTNFRNVLIAAVPKIMNLCHFNFLYR